MRIIRITVLMSFAFSISASAGGLQDAIPDFVEQARNKGINSEVFTERGYSNLIREIERQGDDKVFKKALKQLLEAQAQDPVKKSTAYFSSLRVLYAVMAEKALEEGTSKNNRKGVRVLKVPYAFGEMLNRPIGIEQAQKEALNLLLPGRTDLFVSAEELAELTHFEVSELDIGEDHSAWHTKAKALKSPNHLSTLRRRAELQTSKELKISYELEKAKRVLFFKEIKATATSPKLNAYDNYGVKWKIKWGSEIDIEPMANCLYLKAGGKFTDIVLANEHGKKGITLILEKEGRVTNLYQFKKAFENSVYEFAVGSHILESGEITAENMNDILSELPGAAPQAKNTRESLIGRTYITFKSSMVEFKGDAGIQRIGPAALGQAGANTDRVARGMVIFNQWIWNGDTKDDNSRVAMVKDFDGVKGKRFLEGQHDMGTSMGHPFEKGNPNSLEHDRDFVMIKKVYEEQTPRQRRKKLPRVLMEAHVLFDQYIMYTPSSFLSATYSDARWMAKKVVDISKAEIRSCAQESKMPDFMVEAFTDKLALRRNLIAEAFKVPVPAAEKKITVTPIEVALKTLADREAAAARYGLDVADVNKEMKRVGLLSKSDGTARRKSDVLYKAFKNDYGLQVGRIPECNDTVLMGLIVEKRRSAGLVRRQVPRIDDKPLKRCHYGAKGKFKKAYPKSWDLAKGIGGVN